MRSLKGRAIPTGKAPTVGEVIKKGMEQDERRQVQVDNQKAAIDGFLCYLQETDQMQAFNDWKAQR